MSGFNGRSGNGGKVGGGNGNKWGRGGRGGGRKAKEQSHDEKLSRKLSSLLRHRAHANGLTDVLRPDGYVPMDRVLSLPGFKGRTVDEIRAVVQSNDKQRFSLIDEDGSLFIRANQGHTIEGIDPEKLLVPILFTADDGLQMTAIHGTYTQAWPAILNSHGLSRMSRNHVHLAADLPGEGGVISGMRASCELVVYVDVRAAVLEGGLNFYTSSNGVVLTPGLGEHGILSLDYVTKVENRGASEIVYPPASPNPTT